MKKIEQIAAYLISKGVSFSYENNYIVVTDKYFTLFMEASYNKQTKKVMLLDQQYKEVAISELKNKNV